MRIILVNDHPPGPTGGAEVHVGRLRDALRDGGDEVEVFTPERPHRGLGSALDLWDPLARRRLHRRVRELRPDVVHYHNVMDELSPSVAGLGVPSVLTVHDPRIVGVRFGLDQDRPGWIPIVALRDAKNHLGRMILRSRVGATIAPSEELASALRGAGFPAVCSIPNFATPQPLTAPGRDVVYVGALSRHKGPQVLVRAFEEVARRHPDARLRLVGDGPMRPELEEEAWRPALRGRVTFEGRCREPAVLRVLREAAVVAVPSLGVEGGGPTLAVIEAMCSGRPVVVSDRPGVREGVDDEVGAVVPAGDPTALGEVLTRLLADRGRLRSSGAAALDRAAHRWSAEVVVPRIRSVYEQVLRA